MYNLTEILKEIFSEVLLCPLSAIDLNKAYADMGVDSILAIQISELIKLKTGFNINPSDLYNFYSINQLQMHIEKNLIKSPNSESITAEALVTNKLSEENKIVIVGISIRTADANNYDEFWDNILNKRNSVRESDRWFRETNQSYKGGFLKDIKGFDAEFFKISPKEALYIDPQQRLLLEESWHAFEDAGLDLETLSESKCGVFVTSLPGDYKYWFDNRKDAYNTYSFQGNSAAVSAGRISHFYNLKGPALMVDTACSSSLVNLDLAIKYLESGSCETALVAAVSIFTTPELFEFAKASNILSKSGTCYSFDQRADGFVPSEAVACLVLTTLKNAKKNNQRMYALLEGSQINHDGTTNGLMSPNSSSQQELIYSLYQQKNININQIAYIESHGTGTSIGDPIEIKALTGAFSKCGSNYEAYVGSSKASIGHCLVASGLVSIIKVLMCAKNNCIPGLVNFQTLNSQINLEKFKINLNNEIWPLHKPLAAISAFGFSGTNAHLVLRKFEITTEIPNDDLSQIFIFSSATGESLIKLLESYVVFLSKSQELNMGNLSYTLNTKRQFFEKKCIIVAESKQELINNIKKFLKEKSGKNIFDISEPAKTTHDIMNWLNNRENIKSSLRKNMLISLRDLLLKEKTIASLKSIYHENYQHISLPGYYFSHTYYWIGDRLNNSNLLAQTERKMQSLEFGHSTAQKNKEDIIHNVKQILSEILGYKLEDISASKSFSDYGVDSLVALQILEKLNVNRKDVPSSLLFDCQNIEKFAHYLIHQESKKQTFKSNNEHLSIEYQKHFNSIPIEIKIVETETSRTEWFILGTHNRPLMLLPPLNMLAHAWIQQIKYFVDQSYQIYIPHYPGHGRSTFVEKNLFELAEQLLQDYEKIAFKESTFSLAGWSLGGCLSLIMSYLQPDKISEMLLINCAADFSQDLYAESSSLRKELLENADYLKMLYNNKEGDNIINLVSANCSLEILKHYYIELQKFNIRTDLNSIKTKTKIIYGEKDPVIKKEDAITLSSIPNSEIECFESSGHFIPLISSFSFNKIMQKFISS